MIEFITLSNDPEKSEELEISIRLAIGDVMPWNFTVVDGTSFDIFSGYNHGAKTTRGELLAFVHHDTVLLGNPLAMLPSLRLLESPDTGFIGLAGSRYLPASGCWWDLKKPETIGHCRGMTFHPGKFEFGIQANTWAKGGALFGRVLVLDGVLLMCHRRCFEQLNGFDAEHYKGFHFYDIDITFRAAMNAMRNYAARKVMSIS